MRYSYVLLLLACRASVGIAAGRLVSDQEITQAPAPVPVPTGKTYPVSGTVFNTVTNEPIGRALVSINNGPGNKVGFSGPDGRFQIANVPEGNVFISAQRPGYFDPRSTPFGNGGIQASMKPTVVGPGSNDFRVGLMPESKLVGKVLDADGEPVSDLQVQVMGQQIFQGRKQWVERGSLSTDDRGQFRFGGQMPGVVVVCTVSRAEAPMMVRNTRSYPPLCYPNSPDLDSAQRIDLEPGQEMQADFTVSLVAGHTLAGRIVGATGGQGVGLWLENGTGVAAGFNQQTDPRTGQFMFRSVPNGVWKIHSQINDGQGGSLGAQEEIAVNGADVQGIELRLQRGIEIPVVVNGVAANQPNAPVSPVQLHLVTAEPGSISIDSRRRGYYSTQTQSAEGAAPRMALQGVEPGQYKVMVQGSGQSGCVGTITQGGSDLTREPLTVTAGEAPQPVVVSMRSDCASLAVTAHGAAARANIYILPVPDDLMVDPAAYPRQANEQGSITVSIANLRPGNYHVYAVTDINGLEYMNPEAMRGVPSQAVTLEPNQKASISVDMGGRGNP